MTPDLRAAVWDLGFCGMHHSDPAIRALPGYREAWEAGRAAWWSYASATY